jgi:hypothetical protein
MRSVLKTPFIAAAAIVIGGLAVAGCGSNSVGPGGNTTSEVRSINALQGCPNRIDIGQQNVVPVQFVNLAYGSPPTAGYAAIRSGTGLHYAIYNTGTTTNPLAVSTIDLSPHDPNGNANTGVYTLVGTGICGVGSGVTAPQLVRLVDAFPFSFTGANSGTVGIRVVNLIPDLSGGITLASNGAALHGSDDAGTNNVGYAGTSGFDASHYNSGINLAGGPTLTIRTNANAVLATVPAFTFTPNHAYTLFVIGEVTPTNGGQAITVVPVKDF